MHHAISVSNEYYDMKEGLFMIMGNLRFQQY